MISALPVCVNDDSYNKESGFSNKSGAVFVYCRIQVITWNIVYLSPHG